LSWNPRQGNQNAYYTKSLRWISSKLTPADAWRTCASFCIWSHSRADPKLCAIAVSLPPQTISSWLQNSHEIKILNHVSKFSVASETNVVNIMIAGHGPFWQVFRLKAPSARTQKVIFCTTFVNPGMNLLRNTLVKVQDGSKTWEQ